MPRSHRTFALAALSAFAACVSNPANRVATRIADADRDAKQAVAAENRIDPARISTRTMAVVPFAVAASDTALAPLGFGLAELLSTDLSVSSALTMVDRLRVDAILRELQLGQSAAVDHATAPRAGRVMGAARLLTGRIDGDGAVIRLRARLIDVTQGTVEEIVSAEAPLARAIDAERSLALLILERLGVTLTPAERRAIEQRPTTQLATLLAFGRGAQAEARGDAAAASASFAEASRLDASFIASQPRAATAASSRAPAASAVQRVVSLSTQALNQPAAAHVSEVADAPLPSSLSVGIVVTVRVIP